MRVLVTFAVDAEFAPWRKMRDFSHSTCNHVEVYSTHILEADVTVLLTGVGGKKAWVEATKIIWGANVDVCISSGLAGSLKPEYRVGDVLVARKVKATVWNEVVPCDPRLVELASQCGAKAVDAFHSVDRVIVDAEEKGKLGKKSDAVEMESGEILYEAAAFGARSVAIRAISDAVEQTLPLDFNRVMTAEGDVSITRVIVQAAAHPGSLPALIRFGQQSRRAAEDLAAVLDVYVQRLAELPAMKAPEKVAAR